MSRALSAEGVLVQNMLSLHGEKLNHATFAALPEYAVHLAASGKEINYAYFNNVKMRWRAKLDKGVGLVSRTVEVALPEMEDSLVDQYFVPPTIDESHIINTALQKMFDAIHMSSVKRPQNVRLNGPAGCGKTTTAMEFAARFQRPMLVMDCALVREPRDWFGYRNIDKKSGTPYWHKSLFYRFVQTPNAVIVLDEINRVSPMVINSLLPLLDDRRKTYLEESGESIMVGQGVVFFATTNEGREFSGTHSFDFAQADRMSTLIEATYLQESDEAKLLQKRTNLSIGEATKLVQVANIVRSKAASSASDSFSKSISTRMLLNAAEKMEMSGPTTLRYTLLSHFNAEGGEQSERGQLLKLLVGKFGSVMV